MGVKRNKIRQQIKSAQRRGQIVNPLYLSSCYGKVRRDKQDAKHHAERLGIVSYKCKFCEYYHTGHKLKNHVV